MHRIQPTLHRRWHVESGCCPISKDELLGKERGRPTGQRDDEDILRHCGALTMIAGRTFTPDNAEKGYRTRMTSFLE